MRDLLIKFFQSYFQSLKLHGNSKFKKQLQTDIFVSIFNTYVVGSVMNDKEKLEDYCLNCYNHLAKYIHGDPGNTFSVSHVDRLISGVYPDSFVSHLRNCIVYYLNPLRPLPGNFDIDLPIHRSYAIIKIVRCVSNIDLEKVELRHSRRLLDLYKQSSGMPTDVITESVITSFKIFIGGGKREKLLTMVRECEYIYRVYKK